MRVRLVMRYSRPLEGVLQRIDDHPEIGVDLRCDDGAELFVPWTSIDFLVRNPKPADDEPF